jgi:UDP-N-acetylmuramate: L-alanyl-gamma-D-glutamyl-meso-diaminopimelate ligase
MGQHRDQLAPSAEAADHVFWYQPAELNWDLAAVVESHAGQRVFSDVEQIIETVAQLVEPGDSVVVMSNGGFDSLHDRLCERLDVGSPQ